MAKVASGRPMRSAERLLRVLKCFGAERATLSIAEIARELDLAASTVRRLLQTLEQEGFVRQEAASGRYKLGTAVIRLAAAALAGSSLVKAASPILDALNQQLDEAVQLTVRDGNVLIIIDHRQSRHLVKVFHKIGHRYAPYRGSAAGKALLAWLPDPELAALLPPEGRWQAHSPRGITDLEGLRAALAQTRERGYAINDGETEADVWSVAAPVRDQRGAVVAAINLPCPKNRLSEDRRAAIAAAVVAAAKELSDAVPFAA